MASALGALAQMVGEVARAGGHCGQAFLGQLGGIHLGGRWHP